MPPSTEQADTSGESSESSQTEHQIVAMVGVGPGLGSAVARRFAEEGCSVALLARSANRLESLAAEIRADDHDALAVPTDVTDPDPVREAFSTIRSEFGAVDGVVSTLYATDDADGSPVETDPEDLRGPFAVEVEGVYRCVNEALPDLRAGGIDQPGTVILTNSTAAERASPTGLARSVARGGLQNLAESLARAEREAGVHVVQPVIDGWLRTPELEAAHPDRPDEAWMDTDAVAAAYWSFFEQSPSAWTFSPDLRTAMDDHGF